MFADHIILNLILFPLFMILMILISKKFNLVDKPNYRKIHQNSVVNITGVTIYSFIFFLTFKYEFTLQIEQIIYASSLITIMGFMDDRLDLKPSVKIFFLSIPSGYLILNGFKLDDIGTYEVIGKIELGFIAMSFTFFSALLLINSINYLDGTDGLLIGYTMTSLAYFYFLGIKEGENFYIFLIFIYILLISLIFNFLKINTGFKSLLGDAGSLFIGFFLSFTIITLYKSFNIHPAFLVWSIWLPIYDFLHVTINRFKNKINVSQPDKTHFHHYVLSNFFGNQIKTFLLINIINIIVIIFGYTICLIFGNLISILCFIFFFIVFFYIKKILKKN
jgi:UDP-GlcNAc:undecaprenyl-phosphate GlcNAc-1-phosphate transferase